jgi:hypothetical protein
LSVPTRRSTAATQDPVADVPYTSGYYPHLEPAWMNYVAALGGGRPRPAKRTFTYCELGCGPGLTTVILAASNPYARFVGVEKSPQHIRSARELAAACGVTNVSFLEADVGQAMKKPLPQFDFIGAHGLWSWVGDKVRESIVAFVDKRLKSGGILSLSYNAMPGCAGILPVREMMVTYANHKGGDTMERLRHGLAYVRFMAENRAGFFEHHPDLLPILDELMQSDPRHLAHEYLAPHWRPEYFAEVSRRMSEAGLHYAGAYPLALNYLDLSIPGRFRQFFETAPNREVFETHRDFVQDTRFHIDCYVRGRPQRSAEPWTRGLFDAFVFAPTSLAAQLRTTAKVGDLEISLNGEMVAPLRESMAQGPVSLRDVASSPGMSGFDAGEIAKAMQCLVLAGSVAPALRKPAAAAPRLCAANRALLARACVAGTDSAVLASAVTGGGLLFRAADVLAWAASRDADRGGALEWCAGFLRETGAPDALLAHVEPLLTGATEDSMMMLDRLGL